MENTIAFVGFGELGVQIYHILLNSNITFSKIIVFDDNVNKDNRFEFISESYPFEFYKDKKFQSCSFIIALGYKHLELKNNIITSLNSNGSHLPNIIHKSCFVSDTTNIGSGNIFYPMCNIDIMNTIGHGNIFNNSCIISHDNIIGNTNFFAPGFISSGKVNIGNRNFFGTGTKISNSISIRDNNIIGIGSVLIKNIESDLSLIGNPVVILKKSIKLL